MGLENKEGSQRDQRKSIHVATYRDSWAWRTRYCGGFLALSDCIPGSLHSLPEVPYNVPIVLHRLLRARDVVLDVTGQASHEATVRGASAVNEQPGSLD